MDELLAWTRSSGATRLWTLFITSHDTSEQPSAGSAAVTPWNSWKLFFEGGFLISCSENM